MGRGSPNDRCVWLLGEKLDESGMDEAGEFGGRRCCWSGATELRRRDCCKGVQARMFCITLPPRAELTSETPPPFSKRDSPATDRRC